MFKNLNIIANTFRALKMVVYISLPFVILALYLLGMINGYSVGWNDASVAYKDLIEKSDQVSSIEIMPTPTQTPESVVAPTRRIVQSVYLNVDWGGPDLWESVNKRRIIHGVNPLDTRSELCTIASIRLNELLELGKLDGHEGFSNMTERRSDLEWIFEKYANVTEFLAYGGKTAEQTVDLWENTLGHSKLVKGGEYVWGCVYAQNSFAVAITAF